MPSPLTCPEARRGHRTWWWGGRWRAPGGRRRHRPDAVLDAGAPARETRRRSRTIRGTTACSTSRTKGSRRGAWRRTRGSGQKVRSANVPLYPSLRRWGAGCREQASSERSSRRGPVNRRPRRTGPRTSRTFRRRCRGRRGIGHPELSPATSTESRLLVDGSRESSATLCPTTQRNERGDEMLTRLAWTTYSSDGHVATCVGMYRSHRTELPEVRDCRRTEVHAKGNTEKGGGFDDLRDLRAERRTL